VGGGNASLLITILRAHGGLRGTVIDLAGPWPAPSEPSPRPHLFAGRRAQAVLGQAGPAWPAAAGRPSRRPTAVSRPVPGQGSGVREYGFIE